jgi:hypothetical protein
MKTTNSYKLKKQIQMCLLFIAICFGVQRVQGQSCFVQLNNSMGLTFSVSGEGEINQLACNIIEIMPQGLSDSFKIFSVSAYTLRNYYGSDHLDFEQRVLELAEQSSPYYLLFLQKVNSNGFFDIASAKIKLPETGQFICEIFDAGIWEYQISEEFAKNIFNQTLTESRLVDAYKSGLAVFKKKIEQFNNCCGNNFRTLCTDCITSDEVMAYLLGRDFLGIKCDSFQSVSKVINSAVIDSAGVGFGMTNLGLEALEVVQSWGQKYNKPNSKVYITKNSTFCDMAAVRNIDSLYRLDSLDYDIWIHAFEDDNTGECYLFIRFEYYMYLDNPAYGDYYEPDLPSLTNNNDIRRSSSNLFLIYDPEREHHIISDTIPLLRMEISDPHDKGPEIFFHIVSQNQTFSTIVNLYGDVFTEGDLESWNPTINGNALTEGQKLSLFQDDVEDYLNFEFGYFPSVIPLHAPKSIHDVDLHKDEVKKGWSGPIPWSIKPQIKREPVPQSPKTIPYVKQPWFQRYAPAVNIIKQGAYVVGAYLLTSGGSHPINLEYLHSTKEKLKPDEDEKRLTYVTYTKYKSTEVNRPGLANGKVYIGRSRGYGHPENIVRIRNYSHHKNSQLYTTYGCLDEWALAFKPSAQRHDDLSYLFIRGREQNVIEAMGESWTYWLGRPSSLEFYQLTHPQDAPKMTRSGNAINGILKGTPFYFACTELAEKLSLSPLINWNGSNNCQF